MGTGLEGWGLEAVLIIALLLTKAEGQRCAMYSQARQLGPLGLHQIMAVGTCALCICRAIRFDLHI